MMAATPPVFVGFCLVGDVAAECGLSREISSRGNLSHATADVLEASCIRSRLKRATR